MNINTGYVDNASAIRDEKRRSPLDRDVSGDDINGNVDRGFGGTPS